MALFTTWWPIIGLALMRPLGAMLLMPVFGTSVLGGSLIRNSLALMASLPVLPLFSSLQLPDPKQASAAYIGLLIGEFGIGLLLGFSAAIIFWAMDLAGFTLDTLRGASMAGVLNPLMGGQSSPLGMLFSQLLSVLFLVSGGFHAFLSALYQSYDNLPPGSSWTWGSQFIPFLSTLWLQVYTIGLRFAMPAVVIMVLIDLGLGLINRSAQQLNVFSLAMPIKSLAALLMLIISIQSGLLALQDHMIQFHGGLLNVLQVRP